MDASCQLTDGVVTISLSGRFDFNCHREFRAVMAEAMKCGTVEGIQVDLRGADYIDSSALGMLLMLREEAHAAGRTVTLAGAQRAVKQMLEIANFAKLFPMA